MEEAEEAGCTWVKMGFAPSSERLRGMRLQVLLSGPAFLGPSGSTLEQRGLGARRRCGLDTPARLPGWLSSMHHPRLYWMLGVKTCRGIPFCFEID